MIQYMYMYSAVVLVTFYKITLTNTLDQTISCSKFYSPDLRKSLCEHLQTVLVQLLYPVLICLLESHSPWLKDLNTIQVL